MRLDPSYLHFISREELRILAAIEMGMRNHEYVPAELITRIGNLRGGQTFKTIQKLLKNKFIVHIGNKCDGYKLTYLGYDYLALHTFLKRGLIKDVLGKIGVGKESDIYKCVTPEGEIVVLKLTRLGRNSFRSIKKNREYIQHRTNYNWLYLSRLSSIREFLFMQMLYQQGFPTPKPIDTNRHAILMSLVDGDTLCHIQRMTSQAEIAKLFQLTLDVLVKFAQNGLIHGDYNEFNLMVDSTGAKLTVIDFPQCISSHHPNASAYFNRDVECLYAYFHKLAEKSYEENLRDREEGDMHEEKMLNVSDYPMPVLEDIQITKRLDHEIKTKGHITLEEYNELEKYHSEEERMKAEMEQYRQTEARDEEQHEEDEEEGEGEGEGEQQLSKEEEQDMKEYELKNQHEHESIPEIQQIEPLAEGNRYDEELRNLIDDIGDGLDLNQQPQIKGQQAEDDGDSSSEEEERFKGLTPYEIRIKIKQQKRVEREKRKEAVSTEDYIKKALKKNSFRKANPGKGNHGNKNRVKENNLEIKYNAV